LTSANGSKNNQSARAEAPEVRLPQLYASGTVGPGRIIATAAGQTDVSLWFLLLLAATNRSRSTATSSAPRHDLRVW